MTRPCWSFLSGIELKNKNVYWASKFCMDRTGNSFNIWKKEMTSKLKMCEEALSISLQFYLGLGNPTVLEVDHASPAKGSLMIVSFKGSTWVKHSFLFPLPSSSCQYYWLCGYVVNHNEEPTQAKNNPFFLGNIWAWISSQICFILWPHK